MSFAAVECLGPFQPERPVLLKELLHLQAESATELVALLGEMSYLLDFNQIYINM